MTRTLIYTLVLGGICLVAAWYIVQRFVEPWQRSKDKSIVGRAINVIDSMQERQLRDATAFGSRNRTLLVLAVNIGMLLGMLMLATKVSPWFALYPIAGFAVLKFFGVAEDRRLHPDAGAAKRFEARMFQAWSWPIVLVMLAQRRG